jgi:hypothetical protein
MKNKQVAQITLGVLIITFMTGFYAGFTGSQATLQPVLTCLSVISLGTQCWAIGRLWSATDL